MPIGLLTGLVVLMLLVVSMKGQGNSVFSLIFSLSPNAVYRCFEAFGFYLKKLFSPLPLNLAIVTVHPLYAVVGLVSLWILALTFRRSGTPGLFLALAVLFTMPALVVATTAIAWTPFGERYLYIPSAFAVIGGLALLHRYLVRLKISASFTPIVLIILLIASIVTMQRGVLWGNNLALVEDMVEQSPSFGVAHNEYGVLLKLDGRYAEAEQQFAIAAAQNNPRNVNRMIHLNLVAMKIRGKPYEEARNILKSEIGNKADGDVELLKLINSYDEDALLHALSVQERKKLAIEIIATNDILYRKTHNPHLLYRSGQIALFVNNTHEAAAYFQKAWEKACPDAYYREPARILAKKLGAL
jgi:predicted negative regulator of RcsB-dependent stress response